MAYISTVDAIPDMTSNTAPSGIASASAFYTASWDAWKAFNGSTSSTTNAWRIGFPTGWLSYEFEKRISIQNYAVTSDTSVANSAPKSWTFEGSNDGVKWTVLDTRVGIAFSSNERKIFNTNNIVEYKVYRINISENSGGTSLLIRNLEMFPIVFENKFLIQTNDGATYSVKSADPNLNLIPIMTSNTSPSGVASASTEDGIHMAWRSMDGDNSNYGWNSLRGNVENQWLSYRFAKPIVIGSYSIAVSTAPQANTQPKNWTFEGSNDGVDWVILDEQSNINTWVTGVKKTFSFKNEVPFTTYRIFVKSNVGNLYYITIGEFELHETYVELIDFEGKVIGESDYISYGIKGGVKLTLTEEMSKRILISSDSLSLGSGKVFKKKIDTSKISIKSVSIE